MSHPACSKRGKTELMKENSLDSHRGKVAESKAAAVAAAAVIRSESTASTNFDDDYNEWELGIGDLIIDLDADIEKNNEKGNNSNSNSSSSSSSSSNNNNSATSTSCNNSSTIIANSQQVHHHHHHHHHHHQSALQQQQQQQSNFAMSSGKNKLNSSSNSSGSGSVGGGSAATLVGASNCNNNSVNNSVEHSATVDKGLKMKIKRTKPTKTSEAKHEIVKPDVVKPTSSPDGVSSVSTVMGSSTMSNTTSTISSVGAVLNVSTVGPSEVTGTAGVGGGGSGGSGGGKSKHTSSKGRGGSHREKKERSKEKDKDRGSATGKTSSSSSSVASSSSSSVDAAPMVSPNCALPTSTIKLSNSSTINVAALPTATVNLGVPANVCSLGMVGGSAAATPSTPNGSASSGVSSNAANLSSMGGGGSTSSSGVNSIGGGGSVASVGGGVGPPTPSSASTSPCGGGGGGLPSSPNDVSSASAVSNSGNVITAGGGGAGASAATAGGGGGGAVGVGGGNFGLNSGVGCGGSVPPGGTPVTNVAMAAVTPPSTLSVKLEPKFPNVPISNFASIKVDDPARGLSSNKRIRVSLDKAASLDKLTECGSTSPKPPEMQDMCVGTSVGTITEPECLGPCEPGTTVTLEGIVWQETEGGVLVVNVTWRGKTYVGTLLDCTKHDWAPPRFCESPTSDVESRIPKGRGKRGRGGATASSSNTPENTNFTETRSSIHSKLRNAGKGRRTSNSGFTAPPSPAKSSSDALPAVGVKRKGRPIELELLQPIESKSSKRSRSQSRGTPTNTNGPSVSGSGSNGGGGSTNGGSAVVGTLGATEQQQPSSPVLIECPEPNCSKKYKHINGLRYHQTHAHHSNSVSVASVDDSPDDQALKDVSSENDESTQESVPQSPGLPSPSEKNLRSSPRPFTGKVPAPPPVAAIPSSTDQQKQQQHAVDSGSVSAAATSDGDILSASGACASSDLGTLASVAVGDSKTVLTKSGSGATPLAAAAATTTTTTTTNSGVLRFGQSNGATTTSPVAAACQGQTENSLSSSSSSVGGMLPSVAGSKASSPSSNLMPVITSAVARAASPVAATAAPPSLSPIPSSHQASRNSSSVAAQQSLGLTSSQMYHHHHQFTHPSAALGLDCTMGASLVPSQSSASSPNMVGGHTMVRTAAGTPNGSVVMDPSSPLASSLVCDKTKVKQEKLDKYNKVKSMTTSPTGPHNSVSSCATAQQQQSSLTIPTGSLKSSAPQILGMPLMNPSQTSPISSQVLPLKPIQPKPAAMLGDSNGMSSMDGVKKDKSKHRKKSRDKDRERKSSASYGSAVLSSSSSSSRDLGTSRVSGMDMHDKLNGNVYSKVTDLLGKDGVSRLSADMPLDLNMSGDGNPCNESVQSPAYSDISDANDSTPAMDGGDVSGKEGKEEAKVKVTPEPNPAAAAAHNLGPYSVYSYYGQPPYVVSPMATQSPPSSRGPSNAIERTIKEEVVVGTDRIDDNKSSKEPSKHWSERANRSSTSERLDGQDRLGSNAAAVAAAQSAAQMVPPQPSHMNQHEYQHQLQQQQQQQQQQKILQHQYAYHYGYQYHYMEQAYHMQLKASSEQSSYKHHHHHNHQYGSMVGGDDKDRMVDMSYKGVHDRHKESSPNKEKGMKLENGAKDLADKIALGGQSDISKQASSSAAMMGMKDRDHGLHHSQRLSQQQQSHHHAQSSHCSPMMSTATSPGSSSSSSSSSSAAGLPPGSKVEALSASLKEKQNENHQILKENIELKTQMMEKKMSYDRYDPSSMVYPNSRHEELMRYLLFHEKVVDEMPKKDDAVGGASRHPEAKTHSSTKDSPKPSSVQAVSQHASSSSRTASSPKTSAIGGGSSKDVHSNSNSSSSSSGGGGGTKDLSMSSLKKEFGNDGKSSSDLGCSDVVIKDKKQQQQDGGVERSSSKVQEGQKPTMETQGPPPPTSSYAYMHPAYMQSPHYGPIAFDPTHSVYRGMNPMLMAAATGHYPGSPYLHPQMRYHVPQPPPPADPQADMSPKLHQTKALDLLQHHASQYYSSHKIHELQEHAIKSPGAVSSQSVTMCATKITDTSVAAMKAEPSSLGIVGHDRRSPPLQRHLHTHHHTHVGVGYPILGQYDPYGAIIVGQQAAAAPAGSSSSLVVQPFQAK